jgi:hypothetical protein
LQENLKKGLEKDFVKITAPIYFHILANFCTKNDSHQLLFYEKELVWPVPLAQVLVTTFSTDFSFQNLVFWNLFEFSVAEITLK